MQAAWTTKRPWSYCAARQLWHSHHQRNVVGCRINHCGTLLVTSFKAGLCATDHKFASLAVQPVPFLLSGYLPNWHFISFFVIMLWDSVNNPDKDKSDKILCFALITQVSNHIVQGYQVGQIWLLPADLLLYTVWKLLHYIFCDWGEDDVSLFP